MLSADDGRSARDAIAQSAASAFLRFEIAQTIVHLGADMSQIITQSDLQAGLRYVLGRDGGDLRIG